MGSLSRAALAAALAVSLSTAAGADDGRRTSVTSLGPLPPHPVVAELAPRALRDLDRLMAGGMAWFEQVGGVRCPGSAEELQRASIGARLHERNERAFETIGYEDQSANSVSMIMLSGECPVAGLLSGSVEFVLSSEKRLDVANTRSDVTTNQRVTGFFLDGNPVGEFTMLAAIRSKSFNMLSNGEAIEMKSDDTNLQRLFRQVTYVANYMIFDKGGALVRPSVNFAQSDMGPDTTITITSPVDARRQVTESYRNGALQMRGRLKDGLNHGWIETAPGQPPMCFQNGKLVKAEVCPDT